MTYYVLDERAMNNVDDAKALYCADTLEEAREFAREEGYPVCICAEGKDGCLEVLEYIERGGVNETKQCPERVSEGV